MLKRGEIIRLVNDYIEVHGGYLGDFSYRTHEEFYPCYCDLDINPYDYQGTTRERFIAILNAVAPQDQAKIIRGVFRKYPVESFPSEQQERKRAIFSEFTKIASRLEQSGISVRSNDYSDKAVVFEALQDPEVLLRERGAKSALDRIHTAIHGYLKSICEQSGVEVPRDAGVTECFKLLRLSHPAFRSIDRHDSEIIKVLRALSSILDSLNHLRNRASLAHPNEKIG